MSDNLAADARCGRCGYSTTGLQSLICPECGGDFRKVGIRVDAGRGEHAVARAFLAALFFTITLFIVWIAIQPSIQSLLPLERVYTTSETLKSAAVPGRHYVLSGQLRTWSDDPRVLPVGVTLLLPTSVSSATPVSTLLYDPADNTARTASAISLGPRVPFNVQSVLAWFKQAGLDDQDPNVIEEARMLLGRVRWAARVRSLIVAPGGATYGESSNNPPLAVQSSSSAVGQTPIGSDTLIAAAFIIAWLIGIISLWRHTRGPRGAALKEERAQPVP